MVADCAAQLRHRCCLRTKGKEREASQRVTLFAYCILQLCNWKPFTGALLLLSLRKPPGAYDGWSFRCVTTDGQLMDMRSWCRWLVGGELLCSNYEAHQALCIRHTLATPMNCAQGSHCLLPSV